MTFFVKLALYYRRISQITYQPKIVGKMADFETLTFYISRKFNSNGFLILQGLKSYRVLSVFGKKIDSHPLPI